MPTNREKYFELTKICNRYLTKSVVVSLLMDASGFEDRTAFYGHFNDEIKDLERFNSNVERVANGEPLQYVLGYAYFLGHKIGVNPSVLIPRQETEQLVIETTLYIKKLFEGMEDFILADVCTGSGCIAYAMKKQFPGCEVYASDISPEALSTAVDNCVDESICFLEGNLLEPLMKLGIKPEVLICNPPYIETKNTIDEQTWKYEPHLALLANPKTKFYEQIFQQIPDALNEKHWLAAFEIGEDMDEELTALVEKYFDGVRYKIQKDIYGKSRFLFLIK